VELALGFVGPGEPSSMKFYLPGVKAEAVAHLANPTGELPPHLANVEVEVCARLMGCEVSLDQLLALEKGDVIPIAARVGDPALLTVEGLILAKASLGQHRNQLAVKIEHIEKHVEEMQ
jgi:flagellar motor switch protein FliM